MSVRILHAADLHLDSPFEALTLAQAAQRRREQRSLLRALPELAQAHGAQIPRRQRRSPRRLTAVGRRCSSRPATTTITARARRMRA